jgi:CheY-like chemotaxis protein/HPt (histidine-containing phosphotransfer) domain-containing protein
LRVLVVDDMAMNRDIAQSFLKVAGHEVTCAETGIDAIAAVAAAQFDAVLMDVRMPGMDGLEATRRIRLLAGNGRNVPIIGLTAQAFAEQVEACHQAGMDGHLAKPYGPAALIDAVMSAVEHGHQPPCSDPDAMPVEAQPHHSPVRADLPIVDPDAIARLRSFLPPDAVLSYLHSIAERGTEVMQQLDGFASSGCSDTLADAVHALAGSAGMFGCVRLASAGRDFERSLRPGDAQAPALAAAFRITLDATLREINTRVAHPADAGP